MSSNGHPVSLNELIQDLLSRQWWGGVPGGDYLDSLQPHVW
jgi:hypothetical protein